jgi:hypothetical protein
MQMVLPRIRLTNWSRFSFQQSFRECVYALHQRVAPLPGKPIIVVASAHKVGSTWVVRLLSDMFHVPRLRIPKGLYAQSAAAEIPIEHLFNVFGEQHYARIHKTHSFPPRYCTDEFCSRIKLVTVIRDPRDQLVSAAYYLANLHESQGGWGAAFSDNPIKVRLLQLIEEGDFLVDRLSAWYREARAEKIRYEDLKRDPMTTLRGLAFSLGLPYDEGHTCTSVQRNSFSRLTKRSPGVEEQSSFYRKGIVGDWKIHFDDEVLEAFKTVKGGRWWRIVNELGYA